MLGHSKKRRTFDVPGDSHFLTFSCFQRLPLLSRDRSRRWVIEAIDNARRRSPFDLWAWVIMPEHLHLLIYPRPDVKIRRILTSIKQPVANQAITWLKKNVPDYLENLKVVSGDGKVIYRFWQRGGGYDRNMRSVRDIHEKIRYVHQNPVKRGLVERPIDWHWSSARAWELRVDDPLAIDRKSVPELTILDDDIGSGFFD